MNILLWSPNGAGEHYGGPGMTAFRMYKEINNNGNIHTTLVHGSIHQTKKESVFESVIQLGKLSTNRISQIVFLFRARRWLRKNAKKYDVFHGLQGFNTTIYPAKWFEEFSGKPAFVKLVAHKSDLNTNSKFLDLLGNYERRRKAVTQLSGIFAISSSIQQELLSMGMDSNLIYNVSNGVDLETFSPVKNEIEKQELLKKLNLKNRTTILFLGSITKRKNPSILVESIKHLEESGLDCQLVIVGPVSETEELERVNKAKAILKDPDRIIVRNFVKNTSQYLKIADVFSLISKNEGMPNAVLEAMACGVVVVSTEISGVKDVIKNEINGYLMPPDADASTVALVLKKALTTDNSEKVKLSLEYIREKHDNKDIAQRHLSIFSSCVNS